MSYPDAFLSDTAAEIGREERASGRKWGRDDRAPRFAPSLSESDSEPSAASFPASWRLLDDVEILELPDPQFIIAELLQEKGVGAVYAPPGAGKTTLLALMGTATASKKPFLGHAVLCSRPSVAVTAEDPAGFKMRLRAAKRAAGLPLNEAIGVYTFPDPVDMRDAASVVQFERFLLDQKWSQPLRTIFVDTYAASTPGANENSAEDVTTTMVHAQRWRDKTGATAVFAHHTNASGNRERGHTAMRGAADFMFSMTPVDDVIHLECSKQRNAAHFEKMLLKLVPDPDGNGRVLRLASDITTTGGLSPTQTKVYGVLRDTFAAAGATKSEWQRTCADVPERSFYRACKVLEETGYVKPTGSHFRITSKEPM